MSESNGTDGKELHQMEYLNSSGREKDRLFFGGEAFHPRWSGYMQGHCLFCLNRWSLSNKAPGYMIYYICQRETRVGAALMQKEQLVLEKIRLTPFCSSWV